MKTYKKFNECKIGDTLYCLGYNINNQPISIIPITILDIVTNGPNVNKQIYSKEAIIIKEKVPNTSEKEGEFVIDQYYRDGECYSCKHDIYTTYEEARNSAIKILNNKLFYTNEEIDKLNKIKESIENCILKLK